MNTTEMTWTVGQRAVIDRRTVVTILRVTPAGRPVVNNRTFNVDGFERTGGPPYSRPRLEPLTAEIEAEMDLANRARLAAAAATAALAVAEQRVRKELGTWNGRVPDAADVDRAERLAAAVRAVMEAAP